MKLDNISWTRGKVAIKVALGTVIVCERSRLVGKVSRGVGCITSHLIDWGLYIRALCIPFSSSTGACQQVRERRRRCEVGVHSPDG